LRIYALIPPFFPKVDAVLSQTKEFDRQKNHFFQRHRSAFDKAHYHLKMDQQPKIEDERRLDSGRFRRRAGVLATVIEPLLLEFPFFGPIIIGAPLRGLHLAMRFTAAKGTPQILTAGVSGVGDKKNTAVPASCQA
jgi:hypothetical protein